MARENEKMTIKAIKNEGASLSPPRISTNAGGTPAPV